MKRAFMRAFWGVYDEGHRITKRKQRVEKNINTILNNKFNEPFITYVFGKDNFEFLTSLGLRDCIMIDPDPHPFDPIEEQYRHKLEAIRYCFEEDGYDEMVHLDWDCVPQKKLSPDFWDILGKKEVFQANLLQYHRRKATWRKDDMRKIPNGGFVYIRDKKVPSALIEVWEGMRQPSVEPPMAKYTDNLIGGWKGKEKYWELFEPEVVNLHRASPFDKELLAAKDINFIHYQGLRT